MKTQDSITVVLFDIDGTLLRSDGAGRAATRAALIEVFGDAGSVDSHYFGGKTDWQLVLEILTSLGHDPDDIARLMPVYGDVLARHMAQVIGSGFRIWALPGALNAVNDLRARPDVLLGLITGNVQNTVPIKLRAAGYDPDWFAVGAFGNESADRNHLAALALDRARQAVGHALDPQRVVVVGDTPADVACARAIGARAVAVTTGFADHDQLAASVPDHLLDDLSSLASLI